MKIKVRIALLIILTLTILLIPNLVIANEMNYIAIDASEIVPIGGEKSNLLALDGTENFIIKTQSWENSLGEKLSWQDESGNKKVLDTKFIIGDMYTYKLVLISKDGNTFDNTTLDLNNIVIENSSIYYDHDLIEIEMKVKVPRVYNITVETTEGVNVSPPKNLTVYEKYGKKINITSKEGYKISSITVNGQEVMYYNSENDYQIDPNVGEIAREILYEDGVLILNEVVKDLKVVVQAEKLFSVAINADAPKAGLLPEDLNVSLEDDKKYSISKIRWTVREEGEDEDEYYGMKDGEKFEEGKYYQLAIELTSNDEAFNEFTEATVNGKEASAFYVLEDKILSVRYRFGLLKNEETDNSIKDSNVSDDVINNETKDDTPKTGYNNDVNNLQILFVGILAITFVGIVATIKLKSEK